jgi:hypothetical protein
MEHFDAVERVFLRDPRVYRVFATQEHLYFIRVGDIVRVDEKAIEAIQGLQPQEMLSLHPLNYRVATEDVQRPELRSSHLLLGHGLFWRFRDSTGRCRTFVLHQWGDMTAAVAILLMVFGQSLSTARVDGSMRSILGAATTRATHLQARSIGEIAKEVEPPSVSRREVAAPARFQAWQHSRTRLVSAILFICMLLSLVYRYDCR